MRPSVSDLGSLEAIAEEEGLAVERRPSVLHFEGLGRRYRVTPRRSGAFRIEATEIANDEKVALVLRTDGFRRLAQRIRLGGTNG